MLSLVTTLAAPVGVHARRSVALFCVWATLLIANLASADVGVQAKTRVWDFGQSAPLNACSISPASPGMHREIRSSSGQLAAESLLAARGLGFGADDLALGLNRGGALKQWTAQHGGKTFGEFNLPRGSFDGQIRSAMDQAKSIRFNLDGVDVSRVSGALNEFGEPIAGYTNYELHLLRSTPQYLEKATFYQGGVAVPAPF